MEQLREELEAQLEKNLRARQQAYDKTVEAYKSNYDSSLKSLKTNYDTGTLQVNRQTDRGLREAYLSRMETQRTLPQLLSAQGLTGGMTETTNARVQNQYLNSRDTLETQRGSGLAQLGATYQTEAAQARREYNTGLAKAYEALQESQAADRDDYAARLAQLLRTLGS